jgi:magnesium transporter
MNASFGLAEAFAQSYPETVARWVEGFPANQLASLLADLLPEVAATLLGQGVPLLGAQALGEMEPRRAAQLADQMGLQRTVPLLRRLPAETVTAIVTELPERAAAWARRLLDYRPDQAASRMDPRAPSGSLRSTAKQALELVRAAADSALHYLYVLDPEQRLMGVVSMRELMVASDDALLQDIMIHSPERLRATDPIQSVVVHPGWRRTHALPVVDADERFLGVIRYSAFRALETELGQAHSGPVGARTAEALGELLWIGTTAIGRMTQIAVLGSRVEDEQT